MGNESHRSKKLVYHMTAVANLHSISKSGLRSRFDLQRREVAFRDVADPSILESRSQHSLDKMVPFHFFVRNPFDYRIAHDHAEVPMCLIAVWRTFARQNDWKIVAKHPLSGGSCRVLNWDDGMEAIEWDQIDKSTRDYEDPHCRAVCMAEALSPNPVQLLDFAYIYFVSQKSVDMALRAAPNLPLAKLQVKPFMFPTGCV